MNMVMMSILISITAIMSKGKTHYVIVGPETFLELLKKYHSKSIKERWLQECQKRLEDRSFLARRKRRVRTDENEIRSKPTLFVLTIAGARYLVSKRIKGAQNALSQMINWLKRSDQRFPTPAEALPAEDRITGKEALARIQKILHDT